jgi:hypothetical protein
MYDYFLGGHHYSEADRVAAEEALAIAQEGRFAARENRAFMQPFALPAGALGADETADRQVSSSTECSGV